VIVLLLEKTSIGARVERDFAALDKLHQEYESWRAKSITEHNDEEFTILVDSIKGTLYDLADTLEQIAQSAIEELGAEKRAETEHNSRSAKGRRIWTCVKRIPRWTYVLVIFLAALLTCLYYLGWLEPIRAFIGKIVLAK